MRNTLHRIRVGGTMRTGRGKRKSVVLVNAKRIPFLSGECYVGEEYGHRFSVHVVDVALVKRVEELDVIRGELKTVGTVQL